MIRTKYVAGNVIDMKKKTKAEELVKEFFIKEWNDEKHIVHCQCVVTACLGMTQNTSFNPIVFILAGWLHDMGKIIDKENHHLESIKYVNKFMKLYPEFKEFQSLVEDCILNHRSTGTPKSDYARIFQLADKVALLNRNWIDYKKQKWE